MNKKNLCLELEHELALVVYSLILLRLAYKNS